MYWDTVEFFRFGLGSQLGSVYRLNTYGPFLEMFSFGLSFWISVSIQCCLLIVVVDRIQAELFPSLSKFAHFSCWILVCALTAFSFYAGRMHPDILCVLVFGALYLLMRERSRWWTCIASVLLLFGVSTHMNHFLSALCSLTVITILGRRRFELKARRVLLALGLICVGVILDPASRWIRFGEFEFPPKSHFFFAASLARKGLLNLWLDENCRTQKTFLCGAQQEIASDNGARFLWRESIWGPGLVAHRDEKLSEELKTISIQVVLAHPGLFVREGLKLYLLHFIALEPESFDHYGLNVGQDELFEEVAQIIPGADKVMAASRQSSEPEHFLCVVRGLHFIHNISVWIGFTVLLLFCGFAQGVMQIRDRGFFFFFLIAFAFSNGFVAVSLSGGLYHRYFARFNWVIVFFSLSLLLSWFQERRHGSKLARKFAGE